MADDEQQSRWQPSEHELFQQQQQVRAAEQQAQTDQQNFARGAAHQEMLQRNQQHQQQFLQQQQQQQLQYHSAQQYYHPPPEGYPAGGGQPYAFNPYHPQPQYYRQQSPSSFMTVHDPSSHSGVLKPNQPSQVAQSPSGTTQRPHAPQQPSPDAAAQRNNSTSTARTSFSTTQNDPSPVLGGSGSTSAKSGGKNSAKDKEQLVVDDGEEDGKKKRKRVERACYTCRQKRSKCDGLQPCALCIHNKLECIYPPPTRKVTIKYVEELEAKLAALDGSGAHPVVDPSSYPPSGLGSEAKNLFTNFPQSPSHRHNPQSAPASPKSGLGVHGGRRVSIDMPPPPRPTDGFGRPASDPSRIPQRPTSQSTQSVPLLHGNQLYTAAGSYGAYAHPPAHNDSQWSGHNVDPSASSGYSHPAHDGSRSHLGPPPISTARLGSRPLGLEGMLPERDAVHVDFNPGADTSSDDEKVDESDQRRMMGDVSKWERAGCDGRTAEMVEQGAARLLGSQGKPSDYKPGFPIDDFVTQALAPSVSYEEMYKLPDESLADDLLAFYEDRIHWLFPVLHFPSIVKRYKQLREARNKDGHKYSTKEQIDLAAVNLMFANACAVRCIEGDAELLGQFFRRSQALTSGSTVLLLANVDIINYLNLLSLFSQSCSKGNLSSNATGLAVNMSRGLQLENAKVNSTFDPFNKMLRQRAWAGCLVMEPTSCVMLYRMTGSLDTDFHDDCLPERIDDYDIAEDGQIRQCAENEPKRMDYFIWLCRLMSVKACILREVYNLQQRPTFPDTAAILRLEDRLFAWRKALPSHLNDSNAAPVEGPFRDQAKKLQLRYANVRVLLYRPFLFHFCTTPNGTSPLPNSLKLEMARKSAHVCQEAAIEVIEIIHSQWNTNWAGWWWWSLAFVYCTSLVALAHRIMNASYPEPDSEYYEKLSVLNIDKALDVLMILGWKAEDGVDVDDKYRRRVIPPKSLVSTARRCYRIISSIDKSLKRPLTADSTAEKDAEPKVTSKQGEPRQNMPVPPGRYSRNPDHNLPPLRLSATPLRLPHQSPTYSDDNFIKNWVQLMPPSLRSPSFVPQDFAAPAAPFDMSIRQQNPDAPVGDGAWQGWSSLLGTGYMSSLPTQSGDAPSMGAAGLGSVGLEAETEDAVGEHQLDVLGPMLGDLWNGGTKQSDEERADQEAMDAALRRTMVDGVDNVMDGADGVDRHEHDMGLPAVSQVDHAVDGESTQDLPMMADGEEA